MGKKILATGSVKNAIPLVVSPEYLSQKLDVALPRKKEISKSLSVESFSCALDHIKYHADNGTRKVVNEAALSSVVTPYLRAVIAVFLWRNRMTMKMIQPMENRLNRHEMAGCLILAYTTLAESYYTDYAYFREVDATHMLQGESFAASLTQHLDYTDSPEVLVLNVHHDYLRIHHSLSDLTPILQALRIISKDLPENGTTQPRS